MISLPTSRFNGASRRQLRHHPRMNGVLTPLHILITATAGWLNRYQARTIEYLIEQNRVLLELHGSKAPRLSDDQRRRLAVKAKAVGRKGLFEIPTIFRPDTILGWHRKLVAIKHDYSGRRRGPGRPPIMKEIRALIVRFANENPTWGYTRIMGALDNVGHEVSRTTIANVLKENGIVPAPERGERTRWRDFLRAHWDVLGATDFFSVEVWTPRGLVTYYVLFFMELSTRRLEIAGVTPNPNAAFMTQVARNLLDCEDGFLLDKRYLIHDRDDKYTDRFLRMLEDGGVKSVKLPRRSPNLNAYAERFVRSAKEECIGRLIFFGERSLRRALSAFAEHYHHERNHQGMSNRLLIESPSVSHGNIQVSERLGGLLKFYHRAS